MHKRSMKSTRAGHIGPLMTWQMPPEENRSKVFIYDRAIGRFPVHVHSASESRDTGHSITNKYDTTHERLAKPRAPASLWAINPN